MRRRRSGRSGINPDWTHVNAVAYNADLDQIVVSVHDFSEIWIIDHSTTTAEAAGHTGGSSGKGGDLLYRWGNPRVHRAGTVADQRLFAQHNAHWIPRGLPGEGHLLVFNNGGAGPTAITPRWTRSFCPSTSKAVTRSRREPPWAEKPSGATAQEVRLLLVLHLGAHRLPNGNTMICSVNGTLFEVTPDKESSGNT